MQKLSKQRKARGAQLCGPAVICAPRPRWCSVLRNSIHLKVNVFRTGTGALHNKITTEALAGQHNWDLMNSLMPTRELIERKLLGRYSSQEAALLSDPALRDPMGHWTAIYAIPFVLGYNTNLVKPSEAPKNYTEVLSPQWRGSKISIDQDGY